MEKSDDNLKAPEVNETSAAKRASEDTAETSGLKKKGRPKKAVVVANVEKHNDELTCDDFDLNNSDVEDESEILVEDDEENME